MFLPTFGPNFKEILQLPIEEQVPAFLNEAKKDPIAWTCVASEFNFHGNHDTRIQIFLQKIIEFDDPGVVFGATKLLYSYVHDLDSLWEYVKLWSAMKIPRALLYCAKHAQSYEDMFHGVDWLLLLDKLVIDPLPDEHPLLQELKFGWKLSDFTVDNYNLVFNEDTEILFLARQLEDGEWEVHLDFHSHRAKTPKEGYLLACSHYIERVRRVLKTPTHKLSKEDIKFKGEIASEVDLTQSEIGLYFRSTRCLLVQLSEDRKQVKTLESENTVNPVLTFDIPKDIVIPDPLDTENIFFAKISVDRRGYPTGTLLQLKSIGSGRTIPEILEELRFLEE